MSERAGTITPMPKPRTNAGWPAVILVGIVLLPVGYMGADHAMLVGEQRKALSVEAWMKNGESPRSSPEYRIEQPLLTQMFAPAHQVDRFSRPKYWGP